MGDIVSKFSTDNFCQTSSDIRRGCSIRRSLPLHHGLEETFRRRSCLQYTSLRTGNRRFWNRLSQCWDIGDRRDTIRGLHLSSFRSGDIQIKFGFSPLIQEDHNSLNKCTTKQKRNVLEDKDDRNVDAKILRVVYSK